jgi:hypothetical protein
LDYFGTTAVSLNEIEKMRLLFLTIISILLLNHEGYSQADERMISGNFTNRPAEIVIKDLEKQSGVRFFYKSEWIDSVKLSHSGEQVPLTDYLETNLSPYGLYVFFDNHNNVFITRDYKIISGVTKVYHNEYDNQGMNRVSGFFENEDRNSEENGDENKLIIVGDPGKNITGGDAEISGYIREMETGEPIIGATIYINELQSGTVTDLYGHYILRIPLGRYNLSYRYIGMAEIDKAVLLQSDGILNINMEEKLYRLREIVIEGKRSDNVTGSQVGMNTVNIRYLKEIPSVLGESDIIKIVNMLPGVQSVGEGTSGINVRGGSTDQNLILIDDAPIFNTSHLFGFFSAFNPDVIKEFELYKAGIPAEYGGRISSVFDIHTRSGNKLSYSGNGGISPVTAKLLFEGPLIRGKSSFLVSGRSTYSDWILKRINNPDIRNSNAAFYDLNAKLNYEINANNTLEFSGYYSNDLFTLSSETSYNYLSWNAAVQWKYKLTNKLYSVNSAIISNYRYRISGFKPGPNDYEMNFNISYRELKTNMTWLPNTDHKVNFGMSHIWYSLNPGSYVPGGEESLVKESALEKENGVESAIFISDRYNLNQNLSLYGGVRLSSFIFLGPHTVYKYDEDVPRITTYLNDTIRYTAGKIIRGYAGPELRFSARYVLGPVSSIKISYNRTRQYLHMLSNSIVISPTDIWKLSNTYIPPQTGDQIAAGYYRNFRKNTIESSVEIYYKRIRNAIEYKAGAELLLNEHIETDLINGQGKAYGIEFLLSKDRGRLNGWISYTWSRSLIRVESDFPEERINNGKYFPAVYDKPHDLSIVLNYRFSRRFSFSNNLNYSTGRPVTYPVAKFYFRDVSRLYYSMRNEYRIPDYFRWDISINVEGKLTAKKLIHPSWSFSVYNLTGRENAYSVFFTNEFETVRGYKLSIFARPVYTITYNFRF